MRNSAIGSLIGFMFGALAFAACGGSSAPSTLEARIAALEGVIDGHISVDSAGKLTIQAIAICIQSQTDIDIAAAATAKINGALVRLNGGSRPASGVGDAVAGPMIVSGTPTVLIP